MSKLTSKNCFFVNRRNESVRFSTIIVQKRTVVKDKLKGSI